MLSFRKLEKGPVKSNWPSVSVDPANHCGLKTVSKIKNDLRIEYSFFLDFLQTIQGFIRHENYSKHGGWGFCFSSTRLTYLPAKKQVPLGSQVGRASGCTPLELGVTAQHDVMIGACMYAGVSHSPHPESRRGRACPRQPEDLSQGSISQFPPPPDSCTS